MLTAKGTIIIPLGELIENKKRLRIKRRLKLWQRLQLLLIRYIQSEARNG